MRIHSSKPWKYNLLSNQKINDYYIAKCRADSLFLRKFNKLAKYSNDLNKIANKVDKSFCRKTGDFAIYTSKKVKH